jgi:hypothetical protein
MDAALISAVDPLVALSSPSVQKDKRKFTYRYSPNTVEDRALPAKKRKISEDLSQDEGAGLLLHLASSFAR